MKLSILILFSFLTALAAGEAKQVSESGIKHSMFIAGSVTAITDESGKIIRELPGGSRDGYVLPNGNVVVAYARDVREFTPDNKVAFSYKLDKVNKEISTVQPIKGGFLVCEAGKKPRLLEVAPDGKVTKEIPIQPEGNNIHMQSRMARKLPNGNYLVPHLFAFAAKEYDSTGKLLRSFKTDTEELGGRATKHWPFTAIRKENGNTVLACTQSHEVLEFDKDAKLIWRLTNKDLGEKLIVDACGMQLLPNGNLVIASYGQRNKAGVKMFEVTPEKKVVWRYYNPNIKSVHDFQILTTNGTKVENPQK